MLLVKCCFCDIELQVKNTVHLQHKHNQRSSVDKWCANQSSIAVFVKHEVLMQGNIPENIEIKSFPTSTVSVNEKRKSCLLMMLK